MRSRAPLDDRDQGSQEDTDESALEMAIERE